IWTSWERECPASPTYDEEMESSSFPAFFRRLERKHGIVRFFRRSKEWVYYTCHGEDTSLVAEEAYKTTSGVQNQGGLPTLTISVKMFSSLVPVLLDRNFRIEVWEQESGSTSRWKVRHSASPGNVEALLRDLVGTDGDGQLDALAATGGTAVMMVANVTAGGGVGIAYANTSFQVLGLMQFQDKELNELEGIVVQIGARECLLEDSGPCTAELEEIMGRCEVLCTVKGKECFRRGRDEIMEDLHILTGNTDEIGDTSRTQTVIKPDICAAQEMPLALSSLACLITHLNLLGDSSNQQTFTLVIDELQKYMQYDAAASKAMSVFPATNRLQLPMALAHGTTGGPGSGETGRGHSLYSILNQTCTAMGSRMLKRWLQHPLVNVKEISQRHAMVQSLCDNTTLTSTLRDGKGMLRGMLDLDKVAQRFSRKPVRSSLATLLGVYRAVMRLTSIVDALQEAVGQAVEEQSKGEGNEKMINSLGGEGQQSVGDLSQFLSLCEEVIDLDHMMETGGKEVRVRPTFHEELKRLGGEIQGNQEEMNGVLRAIEREAKATSGKVKLEYSTVHGYHLRVTKKDQTLVGTCKGALTLSVQKAGVLFTTDNLRSLGAMATRLKEQYQDVQGKIVEQAVSVACTYVTVIMSAAKVVSELDVLLAFSVCAQTWDW
ncbi:unnamed protein product, partial [Discosporangium mesarthrocarpum]